MFQMISMRQLERYLEQNRALIILDVRSREEFREGRLAGAVHIPLEELTFRHHELGRNRPVVVYCRFGSKSMMAARELDRMGYQAASLVGGLNGYRGRFYVDSYL